MTEAASLPEQYRDLVGGSIDARGVHPHQAIVRSRHGEITVGPISGNPVLDTSWLRSRMAMRPQELIFGVDCYALAGQGTELADLVAGAWCLFDTWHPFLIEYRHEPRLVKPICWDNPGWNLAIAGQLTTMLPGARVLGAAA